MSTSKIFLLGILCGIVCSISQAQQINGRIINANSQVPIPFVNISIKCSYMGTVSDAEGNYQINIPKAHADATICFSCIGYESKDVSVVELRKNPNVKLLKANVHLGEVTIMPDSTLRSFLRKAYQKIPENYPRYPTQYEAFYREGIQNVQKQYIRLVEVMTKANKSSYKNSKSGTVQLIRSRKYIDVDSSEAFPISFYGGPHFIHELDCVKARFAFLKPHKDYEYCYEGLSVYNNEKVHKISFSPAVNSKRIYKGIMYIHAASLSYLRFDMQLTDPGLKQRFNGIFDSQYGLSSLEKTYVVNYQLKDSICYLKSIFENELLQTKDGHLYNSPLELVVTKTKASAVDAIPFRCQLPLAYVPDREASNYFESDWRSYNTLSQVELIDTLASKKLFENAEQSLSKKDRFLEVFGHLDFSYRLGYQAYHLTKGWRQLDFQEVAFEKNLEDVGTTLVFDGMVAYNLTQRFNIGYLIEVGLGDNNLQDKHGPQLSYKLPLKTMGKNLLLEPQLAYVWHKFGRSVGTQTFDQKFSFGGKDFKQSKVEALPGIRHHGLQIGSSLLYQLSASLYLDMNASYYMPSHTEEVLFLQERSGFFLTRKTAFEPLAETEAILTINDEVTQTSGISYDNWAISIGVRIAF